MNGMPASRAMKAWVYREPGRCRVESVPIPVPDVNELLVRVATCGVCPTDIKKIQHGTVPGPRIFGHETSGTIVSVGSQVRGFRVGQRVALHHHVPCGRCRSCAHRSFAQCSTYRKTGVTAGFEPAGGGYAEYVRVLPFCLPGVVPIPDDNTFEEGALLEPVNTVLKAVRLLPLIPGDRVWVQGQGPIGLLFTRLLTLQGQSVAATDLWSHRRDLARDWGAGWVGCPRDPDTESRLASWAEGDGFDAVVVTVPSDPLVHEAQRHVRGGGCILLFAHTVRGQETPVDLATICVDEKALLGSYSSDFSLQAEVARMVFSRQLDVRPLVTDRFPLEDATAAIHRAMQPTPTSLKVMVHPQPSGSEHCPSPETSPDPWPASPHA
jgi:L-iditol 2-dehydrogenase